MTMLLAEQRFNHSWLPIEGMSYVTVRALQLVKSRMMVPRVPGRACLVGVYGVCQPQSDFGGRCGFKEFYRIFNKNWRADRSDHVSPFYALRGCRHHHH